MIPKDAQQRLHILHFFQRYGLQATIDAFGVSRRTLYRWKARLKAAGGNPQALATRSSAPKRPPTSRWPKEVIRQIRLLRKRYPNLGKARVHVLLKPWCAERNLPCPSVSTIGRIIARAPDKMRTVPTRLDARGKPKPIKRQRKKRKPKRLKTSPLSLWAVDIIERVRDGIRRYILTLIDPTSRIAFAVALPGKRSRNSAEVLKAMLSANPLCRALLSDNGSEFQGDFDALLKEEGVTHYWTYPKSPKMNAHNERFNRSIQESFVDYHEDLLFSDLGLFNRKMAEWLVEYNTVLPHHGLGLKPPAKWLVENHPECQRYWTNT
jgi:transposase InsO family protein